MGATEDAASRRPAPHRDTAAHLEGGSRVGNEALVRAIFDAFARGEGFGLRGLFAEDAVWTVPGRGVMAGVYRGREEIFRFLGRLPKETGGTYGSELRDVLASEERAAAMYIARGTRHGRSLELEQVLLFGIEDGLVREVLALPSDPEEFEKFWAAGSASGLM